MLAASPRWVVIPALALSTLACTQGIPVLDRDGGLDVGEPGADAPRACPGDDDCPACNNGRDDDGDSRTDYPADPGCARREDGDESEPPLPGPCADGTDNDDDGVADYPDDPGCADEEDGDETDPPPPACGNEEDDDGDGLADHPDDPGCIDPADDDESDGCPAGDDCPACSNGEDDDGDGAIDAADAECGSASDDDEACVQVGDDFEGAWPGDFVSGFGGMVTAARRLSGAHDGRFGVLSPMELIYDPSVIFGAPGETASVWARSFGSTSGTILAFHFAIDTAAPGAPSYACMFDLAGRLTLIRVDGSSTEPFVTAPLVRDPERWYRVELTAAAGNVITCRATVEGASAPSATVTHAFDRPITGPVGVRGFSVSAFDGIEVCR